MSNRRRTIATCAVAILLFNGLDALLTHRLLSSGLGIEANALMRPIISTWLIWPVKLGIPAYLGYRHVKAEPTHLRACAGLVMTSVYASVVLWNAYLLSTLQGA